MKTQIQDERNQGHGDDRAAQHALDVLLGEVSEDDADPRGLGRKIGRVGTEPSLRARVQLALGLGRQAADHDGHAGGGLGDVDTVVEVVAERERELVEQQILRGEGRIVRQAMEGRVVAVHVLVQALHDVRKCLDMTDFGLFPVPFGEGIDRAKVVGIGDATIATRVQRVFQRFHAGQVLDDEVRIAPELVTLIEVPRPVVGQLDAGNAHDQGDGQQG